MVTAIGVMDDWALEYRVDSVGDIVGLVAKSEAAEKELGLCFADWTGVCRAGVAATDFVAPADGVSASADGAVGSGP